MTESNSTFITSKTASKYIEAIQLIEKQRFGGDPVTYIPLLQALHKGYKIRFNGEELSSVASTYGPCSECRIW